MSHAVQWLNTAHRVLAHVRAYLDSGQYGECRDSEQACLRTCRHGSSCSPLWVLIYYYCPLKLLFLHLSRTSDSFFCPTISTFLYFSRTSGSFFVLLNQCFSISVGWTHRFGLFCFHPTEFCGFIVFVGVSSGFHPNESCCFLVLVGVLPCFYPNESCGFLVLVGVSSCFHPNESCSFPVLVGKFHFLNYTPQTIELRSIAIPRSKEPDNSQFIM